MSLYRRQLSSAVSHRKSKLSLLINNLSLLTHLITIPLLLYLLMGRQQQKYTSIPFSFSTDAEVTLKGNCYCSAHDGYCMCNPSLAIDLILVLDDTQEILLVRRKDTNQLAVMGGFVDIGETVEDAVWRELTEETGLTTAQVTHPPQLFGVYSDPRRDRRRHTASAVFGVHTTATAVRTAVASDDVKGVERIPWTQLKEHDYFADHRTILYDYVREILLRSADDGEEWENGATADGRKIRRSLCPVAPQSAQLQTTKV